MQVNKPPKNVIAINFSCSEVQFLIVKNVIDLFACIWKKNNKVACIYGASLKQGKMFSESFKIRGCY